MKIGIYGTKNTMASIKKQFAEKAATNLAKTTKAFVKDLVEATPVDTGEAREGWKTTKTGQGYSVENNVEHVRYLNEGSSKQAPSHFIESTALKYGTPLGAIVESNI